jgi:hypothetical protein
MYITYIQMWILTEIFFFVFRHEKCEKVFLVMKTGKRLIRNEPNKGVFYPQKMLSLPPGQEGRFHKAFWVCKGTIYP